MNYVKNFSLNNERLAYFSLKDVASRYEVELKHLPYAIRVLLESALTHQGSVSFPEEVIERIAKWENGSEQEVPFLPSRVVLQDFTGVPAVVDLASMREAVEKLGGAAQSINPEIPVDLIIDHSVQVDDYAHAYSLQKNAEKEFERNRERYEFLKWAEGTFDNFRIIPPATGIIHQVNLEYLSQVVVKKEISEQTFVHCDTLVGTDSHTTMINALGVLGWGVGGIEAEAGMLGEASFFTMPEVIGVKLEGVLKNGANATDLALAVTEKLRKENVVGKFVEYFGEGYEKLSIADRATIANMAPEYGATCGFCPIDERTLDYLRLSGRTSETVALVESYAKENHLFYDGDVVPHYTKVISISLDEISPSLAGPKRPQDRVELSNLKTSFEEAVVAPTNKGGFAKEAAELEKSTQFAVENETIEMKTGDIAIAAITSCTNTSNPSLMLSAGLLAKKAVELGLSVPKFVKTSLAPGSKVVTGYLEKAGLMPYLEKLGFDVVGYGCTTCIGNSGPLKPEIEQAISKSNLLAASVLSGNRNFEGRIHPLVQANFLASPPLVVAYALAGTVRKDLTREPVGIASDGKEIFLSDLLPKTEEIEQYIKEFVTPEVFQEFYADVFSANEEWNKIECAESATYHWQEDSTYIQNPPYFDGGTSENAPLQNLRVLAKFGDSVTTDHISPAGSIALKSPAGVYLAEHDVEAKDFNSYGARRGNHEVMMRGTFGNIRIKNLLTPEVEGGVSKHFPTGEVLPIYDVAMKYKAENTGLIVLAGRDYGMGSSRDWAAKGTNLLGVKAVIAESFERIHRSNLVMMGILPLEFLANENAETLGLTGEETFELVLPKEIGIHEKITVKATKSNGEVIEFQAIVRFDSEADKIYYKENGILPMVVSKKVQQVVH